MTIHSRNPLSRHFPSRDNDAKNPEELLGPVMGSIQQAMEFEDTELGRKMMAKAPKDNEATEQEQDSDFGDWELIGDSPSPAQNLEAPTFENSPQLQTTIEVSFSEKMEGKCEKQGKENLYDVL